MESKDIVAAISKLEDRIIELIARVSEHNAILSEHKNYSVALQAEQRRQNDKLDTQSDKIAHIEGHVNYVNKMAKTIALIAVGFVIQLLVKKYL